MSIKELKTNLATGNDRQRRAASYKLSKLKDPSTVPDLITAFNDNDPGVRQNVISGLLAIGTKDAIEFLEAKGINSSEVSFGGTSEPKKLRSKGCLLSWIAAILTIIVGGYLVITFVAIPNDPSPDLSQTDKTLIYVVMVVGFIAFYFVRKYYNDMADKIERSQNE